MKKFITTSILSAMACLLFVSCKKAERPEPTDTTVALLQGKNWKVTALSVSSTFGTEDIYNTYWEACERDNLYKFNAPNLFTLDEGPSVCMAGDPQTQQGSWSYDAITKKLTFQLLPPPSDIYVVTISALTADRFTATDVETYGGISYTTTWTFARQ